MTQRSLQPSISEPEEIRRIINALKDLSLREATDQSGISMDRYDFLPEALGLDPEALEYMSIYDWIICMYDDRLPEYFFRTEDEMRNLVTQVIDNDMAKMEKYNLDIKRFRMIGLNAYLEYHIAECTRISSYVKMKCSKMKRILREATIQTKKDVTIGEICGMCRNATFNCAKLREAKSASAAMKILLKDLSLILYKKEHDIRISDKEEYESILSKYIIIGNNTEVGEEMLPDDKYY